MGSAETPTTERRIEWMQAHETEWAAAIAVADRAGARRLYDEFGELLAAEMSDAGGSPVLSLPLTNRLLRERVRQMEGVTALDIGCGPTPVAGIALREAGFDVVGVDISLSILGIARTTSVPGIRFVLADGERLPFVAGSFDVITCDDTLEHAFDQEALVREMARTIRPGGRLIVVTPNASGFHVHWVRLCQLLRGRRRPRNWYHVTESHTRELRWRELRRLFDPWFSLRHAEPIGPVEPTSSLLRAVDRLVRLPGMYRFGLVSFVEFERRPHQRVQAS